MTFRLRSVPSVRLTGPGPSNPAPASPPPGSAAAFGTSARGPHSRPAHQTHPHRARPPARLPQSTPSGPTRPGHEPREPCSRGAGAHRQPRPATTSENRQNATAPSPSDSNAQVKDQAEDGVVVAAQAAHEPVQMGQVVGLDRVGPCGRRSRGQEAYAITDATSTQPDTGPDRARPEVSRPLPAGEARPGNRLGARRPRRPARRQLLKATLLREGRRSGRRRHGPARREVAARLQRRIPRLRVDRPRAREAGRGGSAALPAAHPVGEALR
jgi:hypothetical protein